MMKKNGKKTFRRGFTLVELMAATAIMIILVMFVTNIAINMLRAYDKTISTLSTNADSSMVLDPVQEDLLSASMPDDGNYWFEVRYESEVSNLEKYSVPEFMFFSRPQDRVRRERGSKELLQGDLCAVAYKIEHKSPFGSKTSSNAGNLVYGFYRAVLNAKDTFQYAIPYIIGQKGESEASGIPSKFWKGGEQIEDPSDGKKYNASAWRSEMQNFLVDGIVDFFVFFWFDDFTDGKTKIAVVNNSKIVQKLRDVYPDTTIVTFDKSLVASAGSVVFDENFGSKTLGALRSMDVSVTVLSPEGKELLQGLQEQRGSGEIETERFNEILLEHGATFSRSCPMFGGR
ncbi:MAG: prepilin-type N-terminal cleavage/methylation domain-containing protein [Verrucomicrobia bacterium]|nr:prepilin-type N-terminal cleavage/methylation domain-containing protein [Verrucomicrobiota bacterium]